MDISVIIPVKDGEAYIKNCLDSVFNQTFEGEYEVIVGVDPSSDHTFEIVESYKKDHPNLIVEHRRGLGVSINRIDSVKRSKGRYICFLDGDDYYTPNYLKVMFNEIEKGYDAVNCSFYVDRDGKIEKNSFTLDGELSSLEACKAVLKDSYIRGFLWTKMFKRELFELDPLPIFKAKDAMFEDTILIYYQAMNFSKAKCISVPLYYYRDNKSGATKKEKKIRYEYHLKAFAFIRHLCDENPNPEYLKGFRETLLRSKASLWFDKLVSRHVLTKEDAKALRPLYEAITGKEKLDINKFGMKEYIEDLYRPID